MQDLRQLYRSRQEIYAHKTVKGRLTAGAWHLKGQVKHTLYVPITPRLQLAKCIKRKLSGVTASDGVETMVNEKGRDSVTSGVTMADTIRQPICRWSEKCLVDHEKYDCMA